jgi:hypothetical protein
MRQTILVVAALMLVLSAVLFAVSPVHALGSSCPGMRGGERGGVAGSTPFSSTGPGTYNPLNPGCFTPGPQNP